MIELIREFSHRIKNGRTLQSTLTHLRSEVSELKEEIDKLEDGEEPGEDGIVGEALDIINCAFDIIFQKYPNIPLEDLNALQKKKLQKWERKYSVIKA